MPQFSPPSEYTPGTGFGAEVATRETGSAASASTSAPFDSALRAPTAAPSQRRVRPLECHLRERRWTVQQALIAALERRRPVSRSGSVLQQRWCHPATPEYRPLRPRAGAGAQPAARVLSGVRREDSFPL